MEDMIKNPFDLFAEVQETFEEAVKKNNDENKSFTKIDHFRMDSPGKYVVRILPLAPVQQPDGSYKIERKGYEYPTKTLFLKLSNPNAKSKKESTISIPVTHSSYSGISVDLIDTYVKVAEDLYGDDDELIKKIKGSSFNNGLKWNSQRVMYVLDLKHREEGMKLLSLTYSQYKELEDRKLDAWKQLIENDPKTPCPVSSIQGGYGIEITRKLEGGTTKYLFNIAALSKAVALTQEEAQALFDAPRLPEVLYRYSRFHFEATIEFLKQYDEINDLDVMSSDEIKEAIEKIKVELPADDKSHFSFNKNESKDIDGKSTNGKGELTIEALWDRFDELKERGISDKSAEGQDLRDDICEYIDINDLNIRGIRAKSNEDLLNAIENALDAEEENASNNNTKEEVENEPEEEVEESEEDNDEDSKGGRGEHNDDTNEPATRPARRERAARRRR